MYGDYIVCCSASGFYTLTTDMWETTSKLNVYIFEEQI